MKFRNLIRIIVGLLLAAAWGGYLFWDFEKKHDGRKAQKINCVNNLTQISLAFRLWARDHNGCYPFNLSTNAGGTRELCLPDKDGFDRHAALFLQVMAEELFTPKLLTCPHDPNHQPATNWISLAAANLSYRFRSGTNISLTGPKQILAICPFDGNILYSDGSVVRTKPATDEEDDHGGQKPMSVTLPDETNASQSLGIFNTMTSAPASDEKSPKADEPLIVLPEKPSQLKLKP
jgi:hypothetical protein